MTYGVDNAFSPHVYLLAKTSINEEGLFSFLKSEGVESNLVVNNETITANCDTDKPGVFNFEGSSQELVSTLAGKICYHSFTSGRTTTKEYLDRIISSGHESVLEHVSWTFAITNVSRIFSHEHIRHRVGTAISQRSQRYVDESNTKILSPLPALTGVFTGTDISERYIELCNKSRELYRDMCKAQDSFNSPNTNTHSRKIARSVARSILPAAIETKLVWTANARALRHYFTLRGSQAADAEIRKVAIEIFKIVSKDSPILFSDFHIKPIQGTSDLIGEELVK